MLGQAAVTLATLLGGSVANSADEGSWSSNVLLATLLGGSDGSSIDEWSWSSAAGGEDEELPDGGGGGGGGGQKKLRTGKRRKPRLDLRRTGACTRGENCPYKHGQSNKEKI